MYVIWRGYLIRFPDENNETVTILHVIVKSCMLDVDSASSRCD